MQKILHAKFLIDEKLNCLGFFRFLRLFQFQNQRFFIFPKKVHFSSGLECLKNLKTCTKIIRQSTNQIPDKETDVRTLWLTLLKTFKDRLGFHCIIDAIIVTWVHRYTTHSYLTTHYTHTHADRWCNLRIIRNASTYQSFHAWHKSHQLEKIKHRNIQRLIFSYETKRSTVHRLSIFWPLIVAVLLFMQRTLS